MLTVSRDIGLKEPYVGSVELVSGEIAEDLAQYMMESEQIPAAVGLGVLVDTDRSIKAAGGYIVQLMPGAPEELITKLEDNIFMMDQLTTILSEDGVDAVAAQVLRGMEPETLERIPVSYRCSCSRERISAALRSCGAGGTAQHGRGRRAHRGHLPVLRPCVQLCPPGAAQPGRYGSGRGAAGGRRAGLKRPCARAENGPRTFREKNPKKVLTTEGTFATMTKPLIREHSSAG